MSRVLEHLALPLHCDAAEFGRAAGFEDVLAVSMYELDEGTGSRNGMVRTTGQSVPCSYTPTGACATLQSPPASVC